MTDPEVAELAGRLFDMARHGNTDTLREYVTAGVPVDLTNDEGQTLVLLAAYHGHESTVRALVDLGADVNRLNDKGQSALAGAIFKGEDRIVAVLLEAGADPDLGTPSARATAQMFGKDDLLVGSQE